MRKQLRCWIFVAAAIVWLCGTPGITAKDEEPAVEGTTIEEVKQRRLPAPGAVRLAVLPFYDYRAGKDRGMAFVDVARTLFGERGFSVTPQDKVKEAVSKAPQVEPGEPLTREAAIAIGKALAVDWVVYGQILELDTYRKTSYFTTRKKARCSFRATLLDVPSGEIIFWQKRSDVTGGHFKLLQGLQKAEELNLRAAQIGVPRMFEAFFPALGR